MYHAILLKFGEKKHLEALQKGELYLSPVSSFRGSDSIGRLDSNEGYTRFITSKNIGSIKLIAGGKEIETPIGPKTKIKFYNPDEDKDRFTHIACFSMVNINILQDGTYDLIDERMREFGDSLLIINDITKFMYRLKNVIGKKAFTYKLAGQPVEYIDEEYDGEVNVFKKYSCFEYQQEWRCAVSRYKEIEKPFILNIGPIDDISFLLPAKDLVFKYLLSMTNEERVRINTLHRS